MCTEQSNFNNLERMKTPTYPKKKYSAVAPSEFSKLLMKQNKVKISANSNIRYEYPDDVLSCKKIKEIKAMQPEEYGKLKQNAFKGEQGKKIKTSVCSIC